MDPLFALSYRQKDDGKWVSDDEKWRGATWQEVYNKLYTTALDAGVPKEAIRDTPVYKTSRLFLAHRGNIPIEPDTMLKNTTTNITNTTNTKTKPATVPVAKKPKTPEPEDDDMGFGLFG